MSLVKPKPQLSLIKSKPQLSQIKSKIMSQINSKTVASETADSNYMAGVGYLMQRCAESWQSVAVLVVIVAEMEMHGVVVVAVDVDVAAV